MKTKKLKTYSLNQLSDMAMEKAYEETFSINLSDEWWETVYDDFEKLTSCFGIKVNLKKTYYDGFYHGSQGCSYTGEMNVRDALHCLDKRLWEPSFPDSSFSFVHETIHHRVMALLNAGIITGFGTIKPVDRERGIEPKIKFKYDYEICTNYDRIDAELSKLNDLLTDLCQALNDWLFDRLRREYKYLTSKEKVFETVRIHQFKFTKEGVVC